MRCESGFCIVCDKEIAKGCPTCNRRDRTDQYTEVMLNWSNGSRMSMPVCIDCATKKIWEADKAELTKAVWAAWDKMGHTYDKTVVICD